MSSSDQKGGHWKEKIFRNFGEYATIVIYLTLVFAAFTQYRRLVLAAHDISYTNYWIALVEAFILGKVIMIGSVLRIGRGLENMPLIFPALYKAVMFTLLVVVFTLCEHGLKGLWTGKGFGSGLLEFLGKGSHELLAGSLVIFVALTPFFAIRELGRVVGTDKIWALFFRARPRQ
jgi:hypothetical protein